MTTVFFDIDTQIDFLYPAGALYVPGAEKIVPVISELNRKAHVLISTMCTHSEDDPEFRIYPHHCVAGTVGQKKPAATMVEKQHIIEKEQLDCFSSSKLMPLLQLINADRYVVYGVVTEICVKLAAFGLLKTGRPVEIVTDGVCALNEADARRMFTEFQAAGGKLTTVAQIV